MRRSLQPLFWAAEHRQDEDPESDSTRRRHVGTHQQDAVGGLEVLAGARSLEACQLLQKEIDELVGADIKELAIQRRVSRLKYSRRCAEASAVQAQMQEVRLCELDDLCLCC